jgi:anti-anti-sigma factor
MNGLAATLWQDFQTEALWRAVVLSDCALVFAAVPARPLRRALRRAALKLTRTGREWRPFGFRLGAVLAHLPPRDRILATAGLAALNCRDWNILEGAARWAFAGPASHRRSPRSRSPLRFTRNGEEAGMVVGEVFEVEREGQTLILTPLRDLRELDYPEVEAGARAVLDLFRDGTVKNVVLDFHRTDYYGSTALGLFVRLWKRVRECDGRLAFCRVSDHEREILRVTHLDGLWPVCPSREQALQAVQGP